MLCMTEPTDPISVAILDLEAQVHAHRLMLGLLLADNELALKVLRHIAPSLPDLSLRLPVTDRQIAVMTDEVAAVLTQMDKLQALTDEREARRASDSAAGAKADNGAETG